MENGTAKRSEVYRCYYMMMIVYLIYGVLCIEPCDQSYKTFLVTPCRIRIRIVTVFSIITYTL